MAKRSRLYFVSDLHGSGKCFRKFLNGAPVYKADVMVLGGDLAGKAIQAITRTQRGRFEFSFRGASYDLEDGEELRSVEQLIADHGYYPYRAEPGELAEMEATGQLDDLFLKLIAERLQQWLDLADERLRPQDIPLYWMLGNDDPPELAALLDSAPWGVHCEGRDVLVEGHEIISWPSTSTSRPSQCTPQGALSSSAASSGGSSLPSIQYSGMSWGRSRSSARSSHCCRRSAISLRNRSSSWPV